MRYLAETLNELNKEERKDYGQYPKCSGCGQAMVFTFAFPYKEYACLPCDIAVPMFHGLEKIWRHDKTMARKKKLWQEDLSVIARRDGGAECAVCKDESCKYCKNSADENYKFKYWKKNE